MGKEKQNEIVTTKGNFATADSLDFLKDALGDEYAGMEFQFDRVRIPSGGGTVFEMPGADGDETEMVKELTGVILYSHPAYSYGKDGEKIAGTCTYDADTSDADASASEILATKSAYVGGSKVTGSMPNKGAVSGTIDDVDTSYTVPQGYHDGSVTVEIDPTEAAKIIPSNILEGVSILGVTGEVEPSSDVHIESSKTATPYTTQQTILPSQGYDAMSQVVVEAISYTETQNAYGTTVTIGAAAPSS